MVRTTPDIDKPLMITHLLWVAFMILGLPLGLYLLSPVIRWAHLIGMALTAGIAAAGAYCPLTTWEEALRWKTMPGFSYEGSFLAHTLEPILYPSVSPAILRWASVAWGILTLACAAIWPLRSKTKPRESRSPNAEDR